MLKILSSFWIAAAQISSIIRNSIDELCDVLCHLISLFQFKIPYIVLLKYSQSLADRADFQSCCVINNQVISDKSPQA